MVSIMTDRGAQSGLCCELSRLLAEAGAEAKIVGSGQAEAGAHFDISISRMPGGEGMCVSLGRPQMTITCGLNARDTITPSSTLSGGGMAALQREIVALNGSVLQPMEIDLGRIKGGLVEKMAIAAVMMAVDPSMKWSCEGRGINYHK